MRGSAHAPRGPEPAARAESPCRCVLSVSRVSAFPGPRRPHRTYSRLRRPAGASCSLPRRVSSPSLGTRVQTELLAPERPHLQGPRGLGARSGLCACAARPHFRKRKSPRPDFRSGLPAGLRCGPGGGSGVAPRSPRASGQARPRRLPLPVQPVPGLFGRLWTAERGRAGWDRGAGHLTDSTCGLGA